jgi:uncharacterized repeat protein (TIGR01451 family)
LIPPGDIIQTHPKPPGGGYFRNFDPHAVRLEVTPNQATAKLGSQQVFIATVYDEDGQPRRSRRVEWMIEGPGNIVEVDESGWTAGRGYKVNNKYAVSYTSYREHEITRGNTDPRDDFTIAPGQTFCVVSSAVPGETVVMAYAPGVFNWEKGRVTAKVNWGDTSEFTFPSSTSGRIGGSVSLDTVIKKVAEKEGVNPADLRVRYRRTGGVPAEFVPPIGVSGARAGQDFLEMPTSSDGRVAVRVVQQEPRSGRTDVAVEILKPDSDGVSPGKVVGRSNTSVDWVAPQLKLDIQAPKVLSPGKEGVLTLVASNPGKVDGSAGQVKMRFDGFDVMPEQPPNDRHFDEPVWNLPALAAGEKKEFRMRVMATKEGTLTADAQARSTDGLTASARSTTTVGSPLMKVTVEPNLTAGVGERLPVKVVVANPGSAPLDTAVAFATFSSGLEHDTGSGQVEATVGVIPPGESRTVTIPLIARQPGKQWVKVNVRSTDFRDEQDVSIDVKRPDLKLALRGPQRMTPGTQDQFRIGVTNAGDVAIPNVTVRMTLPPGFTIKETSDGGTVGEAGTVVWRLGDLAVGAQPVLSVSATADRTNEKAILTAVASSGEPRQSGSSALSVKADLNVMVQGQPALLLELADPQESVPVGRRAGYRVIVRNNGTGPAKGVKATVFLPDLYANVRGLGANREVIKPEGDRLVFPMVREIPANGTATFSFEVEGAKPGDARVRVEVLAEYLAKPLSEEQSTRVVDRR